LGETLNSIAPHLDAIGITRVANVTGLDRIGIPVVMVTRPGGLSLSVYQGKGNTLGAAKVSGIMEAIERHHGENPRIKTMWGSRADLAKWRAVVDTDALPAEVGANRSDRMEIPWTPMFDIVQQREVLVPFEVTAFQPVLRHDAWCGQYRSLSTGLAAGNSLTEATVHAICEVAERDAQTFWQYTPVEKKCSRRVRLESVDDRNCVDLIDKLRGAEFDIAIWDTTHVLHVPTFYVCIMDSQFDNHPPAIMAGWGAHPTKEVALSRALTEAVQSRLTLIAGARDDIHRFHYSVPDRETLLQYQFEFRTDETPRDFSQIAGMHSDDLSKDLFWLRAQLSEAGLTEILVSDLTREEYGIPVVRVVVPGAEDGDDVRGYLPGARLKKFSEWQCGQGASR